jgi:hypothetical protein
MLPSVTNSGLKRRGVLMVLKLWKLLEWRVQYNGKYKEKGLGPSSLLKEGQYDQ